MHMALAPWTLDAYESGRVPQTVSVPWASQYLRAVDVRPVLKPVVAPIAQICDHWAVAPGINALSRTHPAGRGDGAAMISHSSPNHYWTATACCIKTGPPRSQRNRQWQ
jgi:hypothetical protein